MMENKLEIKKDLDEYFDYAKRLTLLAAEGAVFAYELEPYNYKDFVGGEAARLNLMRGMEEEMRKILEKMRNDVEGDERLR